VSLCAWRQSGLSGTEGTAGFSNRHCCEARQPTKLFQQREPERKDSYSVTERRVIKKCLLTNNC